MIASIFAVVAAPAAAAPVDDTGAAGVDAFPFKTACLGPALDSAGFSDVDMGNAHYKAVNCIAHYGITAGKGDGSFGASDSVTRSQMALFLSGMSALAGITLDDAMDAGFTDLADTDANRVNAINRLVNGGIMTGAGDDTFAPEAAVTRAEMAMWLINFMVAATGDTSDYNVERQKDGTYTITARGMDAAMMLDYFPDARLTQPVHVDSAISAAFELGITAGYGDNEFKGHRTVTRAEMATFITSTLAHTNVRPAGLTAQHDGMGGIQVSLRDAMFAPVANEAVDVFSSFFPDAAFKADRTCETRYITAVPPSNSACEIDAGDTVTEEDGNKDYTGKELKGGGEDLQVTCGTETFDIGSEAAAAAVFWVWTGGLGDSVEAETTLVRVDNVGEPDRMRALQPHHANVSGGLDSDKNQLEARMGTSVRFNLQLHGAPDDKGNHGNAAPDSSGNKYSLVIEIHELAPASGTFDAASRAGVRVGDSSTWGTGTLVSRTLPRVESPDSSGMIPIDVTYADPDRSSDNPDVVVNVELKPVAGNSVSAFDKDALNVSTAPVQTEDDSGSPIADPDFPSTSYAATFETNVIFSDARPDPLMFDISAEADDVYKLAGGLSRPVGSGITISALDQYGNPVRGLSVNAISDKAGSEFPFVQYFTTRSDGSYRVSYHYRGGADVETLTAFAAIANQDHDSDAATPARLPNRDTNTDNSVLEEPVAGGIWNLLLPGTTQGEKPAKKVYWAEVGKLVANQGTGYEYAKDADTGLLAVDVPNKAIVVMQTADSGPPVVAAGPHVYYWDEHDTFQVGDSAVSMALFETIVSHEKVTLGTLTWNSYHYNRPNDRAHWTITCASG